MALGRAIREAGLRQRLRTDLLVPHGAGGLVATGCEAHHAYGPTETTTCGRRIRAAFCRRARCGRLS
jgi:hypothetical protein